MRNSASGQKGCACGMGGFFLNDARCSVHVVQQGYFSYLISFETKVALKIMTDKT